MAKVRVIDLAKTMGIPAKDLLFKLQSLGVQVDDASTALDPEAINAIITGKKLATRPRNVIMRDKQPEPEKKTVVVKPPRPIVKSARKAEPAAPVEVPAAPQTPTPIIAEFIQAAEAEAAEQERAAREPKTEKPKLEPVVPAPPRAPVPPPPSVAPPRPVGPSGPRGRTTPGARPNYQGQVPRPFGGAPAVRSDSMQARPGGSGGAPFINRRPGGPGGRPDVAMRPSGPGVRPGGRIIPSMPSAPPLTPHDPAMTPMKRKKVENEDERPEKKKTTGKRGKRTVEETNNPLLNKGPFSASAVLDEDSIAIPEVPIVLGEDGEPIEPPKKNVSARRDARKQAGPVSARAFEFERPSGTITLTEGVTVKEFADKLGVKANDLMKHLLMKKGMMLAINAPLGHAMALEVAKELDIPVELVSFETALELESLEKVTTSGTVPRGPVITVMGHVDHGKTSLLDSIRETNIAAGEAGGITQHIGAYHVEKRGRKIVFLDTPGHEAFTMMRARGAKATDIVVLVVAADDGVMPQTKEAIDHARAAKVPMVVAINKIDKPNANIEKVRQELSAIGVLVEQWGGDVVSQEVSAVKKKGIDELLDMILLTADMLELKSNPDMPARGVVLEARKEVGRGIVATVLVQDGTLRIGDAFFSGSVSGSVRAMMDDRGERLKEAPPSTPVRVTGFDEMPNAGDTFQVVDEESQARLIGSMRQEKARESMTVKGSRMSLEQLFEKMQSGTAKELNLIIKADVQGSVEVLSDTLRKMTSEQVKINVLHASVGAVSTNDVLLASASDAIVIGFNVRPERSATDLAEKEGVEIRMHTVIYQLIDEVKLAMTGLLDPKFQEVFQGRAEVRDTFKVPKIGTIAGCHVTEGTIPRSATVRLLRDNRVIFEGKIGSLRHFKNDVSEVRTGFECGIGIERFQDMKVGDVIEAFKIEKLAGVLQ